MEEHIAICAHSIKFKNLSFLSVLELIFYQIYREKERKRVSYILLCASYFENWALDPAHFLFLDDAPIAIFKKKKKYFLNITSYHIPCAAISYVRYMWCPWPSRKFHAVATCHMQWGNSALHFPYFKALWVCIWVEFRDIPGLKE